MVDAAKNKRDARPIYRNIHIAQILSYRLPWAGKVSILHRVSGALLFLMLPLLLYWFELSLLSEYTYADLINLITAPLAKIFLLLIVWAYLHHFCAGIRYLLLDLHIGVGRLPAQCSALLVLAVSLSLSAMFAARLFNFF